MSNNTSTTTSRPSPESPFIVAYGMGVDSTAMLVGLHKRGIRPDAILFADVGGKDELGEKPETYAYLTTINTWLASVGFPLVTVVRYAPVRAPYDSLIGKCFANETLPSLAFGGKSCSIVFKREPQDKWTKNWTPARQCWAAGRKVVKAIGYDNGKADSRRAWKITDDKQYQYWYPLRDWGWDREECKRQIASVGLPIPVKSACFFCPASKKPEVEWLANEHPTLFQLCTKMERQARDGKHGLGSTKGLGRNWNWGDYIDSITPASATPTDPTEDPGPCMCDLGEND